MKTPNTSPVSSSSPKPRQHRNREQVSRFLPSSPTTSITTNSEECYSPLRRKSSSPGRHHVLTDDTGLTRHQLWPATRKRNSGTLADRITEDRVIEHVTASKENDRPVAKLESPSSSFSSKKKGYSNSIVPGRLSLDQNSNANKSFSSRRYSRNSIDSDSDAGTPTSRKGADVEVQVQPSSDANEIKLRRLRRGTSDSNMANYMNGDSSSVLKRFTLRNAIKRANSLTGYKSSKSSWALSPGRSEPPVMSVESMDKPMSFSSFQYPTVAAATTTPNKVKGVDKLLNIGFDLFKSKKNAGFSSSSSSPVGFGVYNSEVAHKLRLLDNRLIQWRFANARAQIVNENISHKAQGNLLCVWDGLTKLQLSVLKKKIQFLREKLEMKIAFVLHSQMKLLEAWGGMERQHLQAITVIKECLHSVVCRVPLLEGAEVNMQSTSIVLRHASDLTASFNSILTDFSSSEVDKIAAMLSELAKVVAQEKQLLEEFYDLFQTLCVFELQERSVKCNLVQLEGWQQKYQQQLLPEITS